MGILQTIIDAFSSKQESSTGLQKHAGASNKLLDQYRIPEPTRSLLYVTDSDLSEMRSSSYIVVSFSLDGSSETSGGWTGDIAAEPSMIWTQLPVEKNSELEEQAMYYPSYSNLDPKCRYQYINWLQDVTQPTNLSYVFLYYYGLERHLLVGNYDDAVDEIVRLLQYHDKSSFRSYASAALITSSLFHKRSDILDRAPFLLKEVSNEALAIRIWAGEELTADNVIELAYDVGFKNKRYIKKYPHKFREVLSDKLQEYVQEKGGLLLAVDSASLKRREEVVFANTSIPPEKRSIPVPQVLDDSKFKVGVKSLLEDTHAAIKELSRKKML